MFVTAICYHLIDHLDIKFDLHKETTIVGVSNRADDLSEGVAIRSSDTIFMVRHMRHGQ
jgi:hypothetical protein